MNYSREEKEKRKKKKKKTSTQKNPGSFWPLACCFALSPGIRWLTGPVKFLIDRCVAAGYNNKLLQIFGFGRLAELMERIYVWIYLASWWLYSDLNEEQPKQYLFTQSPLVRRGCNTDHCSRQRRRAVLPKAGTISILKSMPDIKRSVCDLCLFVKSPYPLPPVFSTYSRGARHHSVS